MHQHSAQFKPRFDYVATVYDAENSIQRDVFSWLLSYIPKRSYSSILDIGCASGALTEKLRTTFKPTRIRGIDVSKAMIAEARRCYPKIIFDVQSAQRLGAADRADLVVSNATLQWVDELNPVWRALSEFVQQGSDLVFSVFLPGTYEELAHGLRAVVCPDIQIPAERFLTEQQLREQCERYFPNMIVHTERKQCYFASVRELLWHIKRTGTSTSSSYVRFTREKLALLDAWFEREHGGVEVSYDVLIGAMAS